MRRLTMLASGIFSVSISIQAFALSGILAGLSERTASPVARGEFPYVALLEINKQDGFVGACASALIAPDTLLTSKECADEINKSHSARATFVNVSGRPRYSVVKGIPFSSLQNGPLNQLGQVILSKVVENIDPVPFNQDDSLVETGVPLVFVGPSGTLPEGELSTFNNIDVLTARATMISADDHCSEISDMRSGNYSTFCMTGDEQAPSVCTEDRGGPFFLLNSDGQHLLMGVLTNSLQCNGSNNTLLAASTSERQNQNFILRHRGTQGEQAWSLVEDQGNTPPGVFSFAGTHACVATIEGRRYMGYYYDAMNDETDGSGSAPTLSLGGCMVLREYTACIASQFSHVVGSVPGTWTFPHASPSDRRISFADSDNAYPCVRDDANTIEMKGRIFPTILAGRWNEDSDECEVWDKNTPLPDCESSMDSRENGNLVKMPGDRAVGILTRLGSPESEKSYLGELIGVSSVLGALIVVETGALIGVISTLAVTCKKLPKKEKK